MIKKRSSTSEGSGIFRRLVRSVFAIVILTAFVLGTAFLVRQISEFNYARAQKFHFEKLLLTQKLYSSVLSKVGIDERKMQEVAGAFIEKVAGEDGKVAGNEISPSFAKVSDGTADAAAEKKLLFSAGLMSDSENNFGNLEKALVKAKENNVSVVFFLGDATNWGDVESLVRTKEFLSSSGIDYYALPGDHDLAKSVAEGDTTGLKFFKEVFGNNFHTVSLNGYKFVLLDNSANYSTISGSLMAWFNIQVAEADFVILSQPLYHPTINRTMGVIDGQQIKKVKEQADELLDNIRKSSVKSVISADHHLFSKNKDPKDSSLEHVVIGALTDSPNLKEPAFVIMKVYEEGSYTLTEITL